MACTWIDLKNDASFAKNGPPSNSTTYLAVCKPLDGNDRRVNRDVTGAKSDQRRVMGAMNSSVAVRSRIGTVKFVPKTEEIPKREAGG